MRAALAWLLALVVGSPLLVWMGLSARRRNLSPIGELVVDVEDAGGEK